jgi:hypothetical protein
VKEQILFTACVDEAESFVRHSFDCAFWHLIIPNWLSCSAAREEVFTRSAIAKPLFYRVEPETAIVGQNRKNLGGFYGPRQRCGLAVMMRVASSSIFARREYASFCPSTELGIDGAEDDTSCFWNPIFGKSHLGVRSVTMRFVLAFAFVFTAVVPLQVASAADLPGTGDDAGKIVVYRDSWGVPHIYAPTVEGGTYAMGWTQAQDRPTQLLRNLARGLGEISKADGQSGIQSDVVAKTFRLYESSK